jgi:hypothetical protein
MCLYNSRLRYAGAPLRGALKRLIRGVRYPLRRRGNVAGNCLTHGRSGLRMHGGYFRLKGVEERLPMRRLYL